MRYSISGEESKEFSETIISLKGLISKDLRVSQSPNISGGTKFFNEAMKISIFHNYQKLEDNSLKKSIK